MDGGTKQTHEDLQSKIVGGDGYQGQHGTWVAGVAGAATDNTKGVASLGWNIVLHTYGLLDGNYDFGDEDFMADNIYSAAQHCDVINMSWGTFRQATIFDMPEECSLPDKWDDWTYVPKNYQSILDAVSNAIAQGVVCITAAGNRSINHGNVPSECDPAPVPFTSYPAAYGNVIAVTGTELVSGTEQFNDGWNYGSFVDVAAPGKGIWTTDLGGGYVSKDGTSFSSPLVAALAGLILSENPSATVQEVTDIITSTSDKIDASRYPYNGNGWNSRLGYGRINAYRALSGTGSQPPSPPTGFLITNASQIGQNPNLSWNASSGATLYNIYRRVSFDPEWFSIGNTQSTSYTDNTLTIKDPNDPMAEEFFYHVKAVNSAGESGPSNSASVWGFSFFKVLVGGTGDIPGKFSLAPNYPNPFNPVTTIRYALPEASQVNLVIYDVAGREVRTWNRQEEPGYRQVVWDGRDNTGIPLPTGVYIYRLTAQSTESERRFTQTRKLVLLK